MQKEFIFASGISIFGTFIGCRSFYTSDLDKKFNDIGSKYNDLRNETNHTFDVIDRKLDKLLIQQHNIDTKQAVIINESRHSISQMLQDQQRITKLEEMLIHPIQQFQQLDAQTRQMGRKSSNETNVIELLESSI